MSKKILLMAREQQDELLHENQAPKSGANIPLPGQKPGALVENGDSDLSEQEDYEDEQEWDEIQEMVYS